MSILFANKKTLMMCSSFIGVCVTYLFVSLPHSQINDSCIRLLLLFFFASAIRAIIFIRPCEIEKSKKVMSSKEGMGKRLQRTERKISILAIYCARYNVNAHCTFF